MKVKVFFVASLLVSFAFLTSFIFAQTLQIKEKVKKSEAEDPKTRIKEGAKQRIPHW